MDGRKISYVCRYWLPLHDRSWLQHLDLDHVLEKDPQKILFFLKSVPINLLVAVSEERATSTKKSAAETEALAALSALTEQDLGLLGLAPHRHCELLLQLRDDVFVQLILDANARVQDQAAAGNDAVDNFSEAVVLGAGAAAASPSSGLRSNKRLKQSLSPEDDPMGGSASAKNGNFTATMTPLTESYFPFELFFTRSDLLKKYTADVAEKHGQQCRVTALAKSTDLGTKCSKIKQFICSPGIGFKQVVEFLADALGGGEGPLDGGGAQSKGRSYVESRSLSRIWSLVVYFMWFALACGKSGRGRKQRRSYVRPSLCRVRGPLPALVHFSSCIIRGVDFLPPIS